MQTQTHTPPIQVSHSWRRIPSAVPTASVSGIDNRTALVTRFAGLLGLATMPFWIWALFYSHNYQTGADYLIVFVVVAAGIAFVMFTSAGDLTLREIMLFGLLLKYAAGSAYIFVVYRVYFGAADLATYNTNGYLLASDFTTFGHWPILVPLIGSNFVTSTVAMMYSMFGPSLPGACAIYLTIAFIGQYLLYQRLSGTPLKVSDPRPS